METCSLHPFKWPNKTAVHGVAVDYSVRVASCSESVGCAVPLRTCPHSKNCAKTTCALISSPPMVAKAPVAAPSCWTGQILDSNGPKLYRRRRLHSSLARAGADESDKDVVQDVGNNPMEGASTSRGAGDVGAPSNWQNLPFSEYAKATGVSITELVTLEPGAFPFADEDSEEAGPTPEEAGPTAEEANVFAVKSGSLLSSTKRGGPGAQIADILYVYGGLLDRPFSDGNMIATAGRIALERLNGDMKELFERDDVDQQMLFELQRCLKLLDFQVELIGAAKKRETLLQRLEEAKVPCRQAMQIAENL